MVYFEGSFIYFGGDGSRRRKSTIASFDSTTRQWSYLGTLVTGREDHGATFDGKYFLVVGGFNPDDDMKTEKCSLSNSTMTCQQQQPDLFRYEAYPELFIVPDDFCKNT